MVNLSKVGNKRLQVYSCLVCTSFDLGTFYEHQLVQVKEPEVYKVEQILRWRTLRNGQRQAYVRWLGYGPKFDQWVDETEIVNI
jgi:hypothetical protein